eukprot:08614.XXX_299865_301942_1 [CDS] Oithona nana genome sequencing.
MIAIWIVELFFWIILFQDFSGQKSNPLGSELKKGQVKLFRRWPETQLRYVEEEYESFTTEGGKEVVVQQRYKGLLLSSCQSVPMFSLCNNMKEEVVKQTHGKRSPESNFDCRQLREKWLFFTEEFCPRKLLKCTMKPHCSGISCKCCEEIRCLSATPTMTSYPKDLSSSPTAKTPMGSLVIKKCTRTLTFEEYTSSCTGSCSGQQQSFKSQTNLCQANKDDGICLRKIHQCQGLVCLCCDHVTCFPTVSHGEKFQDHLHPEDLHVLHLSNVFGRGRGRLLNASWDNYSSAVLNNSEVIDKVGSKGGVVPDVHNLFPIGSTTPPKFWSAAEAVAAIVHSSSSAAAGRSLQEELKLLLYSIVLFYILLPSSVVPSVFLQIT